ALDEPFLQEAFRRKIPVFGDIECLAREIDAPVIAITGTNGKSPKNTSTPGNSVLKAANPSTDCLVSKTTKGLLRRLK
ncbi:hypothetical protein ACN4Z3_17295, partial [Legionella sp. 29fVS95]